MQRKMIFDYFFLGSHFCTLIENLSLEAPENGLKFLMA